MHPYDLHPEAKFHGGTATKSGELVRRRVYAQRIRLVGKESHEWEENEALGLKADAEVQFGAAMPDIGSMTVAVRKALEDGQITSNQLARMARVSKTTVSALRNGGQAQAASLLKMYDLIRSRRDK